jgi:hypothetical protein
MAARLLGAHVTGFAFDDVLGVRAVGRGVVRVGDAEVAELDLALEADE